MSENPEENFLLRKRYFEKDLWVKEKQIIFTHEHIDDISEQIVGRKNKLVSSGMFDIDFVRFSANKLAKKLGKYKLPNCHTL